MANEVTIIVKAKDKTGDGFMSARRNVDKLSKDILLSGSKAGAEAGMLLTRQMALAVSNGIRSMPPQVQILALAAGAVVGASVATGAAAALSGATLGAAAVGAVAGGLALAARDGRVKDAASGLMDTIMGDLDTASGPFIAASLRALDSLREGWADVLPGIQRALTVAAKFVDPLVAGVRNLVTNFLPSFVRALERAGPVIDVIRDGLSDTGKAMASFMDSISENPHEAAAGLQALFDIINVIIEDTGILIGQLTSMFDEFTAIGAKASGVAEDLLKPWGPLADYMADTNDEFERLNRTAEGLDGPGIAGGLEDAITPMFQLGVATREAQQALDELNKEFDRAFGKLMNVDEATLAYKESLIELRKEFKDNGNTLDENTAKGLANRDAILGVVDSINRQREAAIAAGDGSQEATDRANAAYRQQIEDLKGVLRQLGLTEAQINTLLAKYQELAKPLVKRIDVIINETIYRAVRESGRSTPIYDVYQSGIGGRASGGVASGMTWVGERGPELVDLPPGSMVHPAGQSERMAAGMAGPSTVAIDVTFVPTGDAVMDAIMEGIRFQVRQNGGDPGQAFG